MAHTHDHDHSRTHIHEHPICIATIIYNMLVIAVELIIIAAVNHLTRRDLLGYEGVLQGIHLLGIVILAFVNRRRIHHRAKESDSTVTTTGKFFSISTIILIAHILLLHVIPRIIGFELHHDSGGSEMLEFIVLGGIIIFVTLSFGFRDMILERLKLKNRFTVSLKKK